MPGPTTAGLWVAVEVPAIIKHTVEEETAHFRFLLSVTGVIVNFVFSETSGREKSEW